jgi:DNA-binding NtrC family response regulator
VLINGETGVGKELIARELHHQSDRRKNAFVPVNVGAIPETLAAAHLFGHERGAFTDAVAEREGAFAAANGGVLFLDEIGDMPFSIQAHLLRVLDDGLVAKLGAKSPRGTDFRLICATNVNLKDSVKGGRFRRDLYYRINVLVIDTPPLRERGDDVIEIFEAMIASHRNEDFRTIKLTPKAGDKLRAYAFPGNVRELRNVLARALVHSRGGKILPSDLVFDDLGGIAGETSFDVGDAKEKIGRFLILKALKTVNGNVTQAAALTGRSRGTVQTVKKKLGGEDFAKAYKAVCADIKALLDGC